jgi:hypothetical protein
MWSFLIARSILGALIVSFLFRICERMVIAIGHEHRAGTQSNPPIMASRSWDLLRPFH